MSDLFRKSALDKLSSPEQLDRAIVITPRSFWVALLGGVLVVVGAVIWGIFGRLPVNVEADGIYLSGEGTGSVYSEVTGIVTDVKVESGMTVKPGALIAYVGGGDVAAQVKLLGERILAVENITLDSVHDISTADNKPLIDMKREVTALTAANEQNRDALKITESRLNKEKKKTDELKEKAEAAKNSYYDGMEDSTGNAQQLSYSESQTRLNTARQYLESANAACQKAELETKSAQNVYDTAKEKFSEAKSQTKKLEEDYKKCQKNYNALKKKAEQWLARDENTAEAAGVKAALEEASALLSQSASAYSQGKQALASMEQAVWNADASLTAAEQAESAAADTQVRYSGEVEQAQAEFENARDAYLSVVEEQAVISKKQNISGNEYSQANTEYSAQRSIYEGLKQEADGLKLKIRQGKEETALKKEEIQKAFTSTKESVLSSLKAEFDQNTAQLKKYEIVSTQSGVIQEVVAAKGTMVAAGSEIIKVKHGSEEKKEAVCYIPVSSGKKIKPGMEVMIYPSTVNKQEYGHMTGTVESVASYITSAVDMMKRLGDETLAQSFMKKGPVMEVVCSIRRDSNTASGYFWSSRKGADLTLVEGTILSADIVTEKKAPITMVIPYLKEKLTMQTDADAAGIPAANLNR